MGLLQNIVTYFKNSKNNKNVATFHDIIVRTVSEPETLPETSNDLKSHNSNPETEPNDSSSSKYMENCKNSIEINTINAGFNNEINVTSDSPNKPTTNNNIDSTKHNNKNNIEENLPNETESFSNQLQDNTNNKPTNNSNIDENTIKCIEEFDTILGNLQTAYEPINLDEFEELLQEHDYLLNIDTEESIPVHVINKNDFSENDTIQRNNKLEIKDDTDLTAEKIEIEVHGNVKLDSTEIDANFKTTEVFSMKIIDNNTQTSGNNVIDCTNFDNNTKIDNPISIDIDANLVSENVNINSQETSSIAFDTVIKVDNAQEVTVIEFDNAFQVDRHLKQSLKEVNNSIKLKTNELENNNKNDRKLSPIDADNNNLKVENNTETTQQDNNAIQDGDSNENIPESKNTIATKFSHLIEITLTKISNDNNDIEPNNVQENLEVISISSDGILDLDAISIISDKTTESDCGYQSSDFEFISENEAKLDGFIINYRPKDTPETPEENQSNFEPKTLDNTPKTPDENEPGPSRLNPNNNYECYRNRYARPVVIDRTYRNMHDVPEGEGFMDLFRGMYNPAFTSMVENKSIRTNSMLVEFEGIGFERQFGRRRYSSEDEYEHEAEITAKKIQQMYPGDNRKRRRRF